MFLSHLLLVSSLLHTVSSTVYYVIPDDHYTSNNNTYTLQHYLSNTRKFFTSHTQLHFLPGQYYLDTDLIIQNVSNLSLIGNRTNGVINTVINCTSPAGIVVYGSSNIVIANIEIKECGNEYKEYDSLASIYVHTDNHRRRFSLLVFDSQTVTCEYFHSTWHRNPSGIKIMDTLGNTTLLHVVSTYLKVWFTGRDSLGTNLTTHAINIESYQIYSSLNYIYAIDMQHANNFFDITVNIIDITFQSKLALFIRHEDSVGEIILSVINCKFTTRESGPVYQYDDSDDVSLYDNSGAYDEEECQYSVDNCQSLIYLHYENTVIYTYYSDYRDEVKFNRIQFIGCKFQNISQPSNGTILHFTFIGFSAAGEHMLISIRDSLFDNNYYMQAMLINSYNNDYEYYYVSVLVNNVTVSSSVDDKDTMVVYQVKLILQNVLLISNIVDRKLSAIIEAANSHVEFGCYNEFSSNKVHYAVSITAVVFMQENTILNFTINEFFNFISSIEQSLTGIDLCAIQYLSNRGNLDNQFQLGHELNYSVVIFDNKGVPPFCSRCTHLVHCAWDPSSAFKTSIPLHVNQKFIKSDFIITEEKRICLCSNNSEFNCYSGIEGPFYPGETLSLHFVLHDTSINTANVVIKITKDESNFTCDHDQLSVIQLRSKQCQALEYTINLNGKWCELTLEATAISVNESATIIPWRELYTITLQPCPIGFTLHPLGYCQCDPILSSHIPLLTTCDIDHQTIPRPASTWISAHTINNSHSYHVSLHCPFDYCLPHSSPLNLSTPDSQCQFNRSDVLCGHCQRGLSIVFGSSQCKHCSSIYLLIIVPLGIAGIVLVLSLFALNLTVTDGKVNPFLLYVNIVSINRSALFLEGGSLSYIFISLANLDLGIETCFYDGMDDYATMWLQIAYPIYLVFIATLLIMASRYCTTIQRLTARRALPVLATLFLLSYTKVLLTVSNVLFFYTSITHLPSNHTTLVWSVDANVPLFGVKFTVLFIACLILFLALVPFNVVLLFTRTLSYFKVVTNFKPLLDAYQGPYKIRFYYWTGLQLVMRAIFFGVSALNRDTNLMISSIMIGITAWLHGKLSPFNCTMKNAIESTFLINLLVMFIVSQYTPSPKVVNILVYIAMVELLLIALYNGYVLAWNRFLYRLKLVNKVEQIYKKIRQRNVKEVSRVELVNVVPEVKYNYKEFQEPVLAIGYEK